MSDLDEARYFADRAAEKDDPITTAHLRTLLAELDRRGAAIERVRKLHSPDKYGDCLACGLSSDEEATPWSECPTIAALEGQ